MGGIMVLVAAAAMGIDTGYQPSADGGLEYIIQIEPQLIESLKNGEDFVSDIPLTLRGVHHYRITFGNKKLPKLDGSAEKPPALDSAAPKSAASEASKEAGGRETPSTFATEPDAKSMERTVNHVAKPENAETGSKTPEKEGLDPSSDLARKRANADELADRPWLPLALALMLFGSLGANIYLVWVTASTKSRYRKLVRGRRDEWPLGD
jgi:hypothetical protein